MPKLACSITSSLGTRQVNPMNQPLLEVKKQGRLPVHKKKREVCTVFNDKKNKFKSTVKLSIFEKDVEKSSILKCYKSI